MSDGSSSPLSNASAKTWRVDPGVLTWRGGKELVAYHLCTGRSYRLPGLPARVRELLELGLALDVAAPPAPTGGDEHYDLEYNQLLEMLEREQLIGRVEEPRVGEGQENVRSELFLIIGSDAEGAEARGNRGVSASALHAGTVLQRVPKVVIELRSSRAHVSSEHEDHQRLTFSGGMHALRLLDAFERPRTVQEVVRVLQRRVRRSEGWISLVEALVRLFEGGVLREVKRDERRGGGKYIEQFPPSDRVVP